MSLFRKREQRAISYQDVWGTDADPLTAGSDFATFVPVFASVRLLADAVAQTPLEAYARGSRLQTQPGFLTRPSVLDRRYEWLSKLMYSLLIRGNAFGLVTGLGWDGWPTSLEWLNPAHCDVIDDENVISPVFTYRGQPIDGTVLHIPAFPIAGKVLGVTPIRAFRDVIEVGRSAQSFARDLYRNNGVPGAVVQHKKLPMIDEATATTVKAKYKTAVRGRDVLVIGNDWDVSAMSMPADDAQFLATIKATANQVAAIYGVPAERIGGEASSSRSYSNLDMDLRYLRQTSVAGWMTQIEQAVDTVAPPSRSVHFNPDSGIRLDAKTRAEIHDMNLRTGVETLDEARADENKPPLTPDELAAWLNRYGRPTTQGSATP